METILIVDDDTELSEMLAEVIESEGYDTDTADSLDRARARLAESVPDLLILDIMFPENPAGGFDLARELRASEATRSLPIILLTAVNQELPMDFSSKDIDDEWMPVQDFVEKPPDIASLMAKVRDLLDRS